LPRDTKVKSHAKAQSRKGSKKLSGLCGFAPLREIVFYRPLVETGIKVVRILHSSRDLQPDFF
jgi:hypothetical protein